MKCLTYLLCNAVIAVSTLSVQAGSAFFSADGKTVTVVPRWKTDILWQLNIDSGKLTELTLPAELKKEGVGAIARGGDGETLLTSGGAVWVLKEDGTAKRICDLGAAKDPSDLFVATGQGAPVSDWLFVSAPDDADSSKRHILYARKPGAKAFQSVFCRRIENVYGGVFGEGGRLFFHANGDIWEGGLSTESEEGMPAATLVGARIAPLAMLNTDGSNGGSMLVNSISPAGKWIYAGLRGHHMGCIMRVALPAKPIYTETSDDIPDAKAHLAAMKASLDKTEILVENTGALDAFAACEVDGNPLVFYRGDTDDEGLGLWLWTGKGAPRRLATEPSE